MSMTTPDVTLLQRLLSSTDFTNADSTEHATAQLTNRTVVIRAATGYVTALGELQKAIDTAPIDLPASVAAFLAEVQQ